MTSAIAPVAAEIIAGRPPANAIVTAIVNDAYSPTRGSTPAMIENEIASGIRASATTSPARISVRGQREASASTAWRHVSEPRRRRSGSGRAGAGRAEPEGMWSFAR